MSKFNRRQFIGAAGMAGAAVALTPGMPAFAQIKRITIGTNPAGSIYYSLGVFAEFDHRLLAWINALHARRQSGHAPNELVALDHVLHELRLFKSRSEQSVMRRAAKIAVAAHRRAMAVCRPGLMEYELEAEFAHEFRRHGAECSYSPIVAAGDARSHGSRVFTPRFRGLRVQLLLYSEASFDSVSIDLFLTFSPNSAKAGKRSAGMSVRTMSLVAGMMSMGTPARAESRSANSAGSSDASAATNVTSASGRVSSRPTKPSRAAKQRRLDDKKRRGEIKRSRRGDGD